MTAVCELTLFLCRLSVTDPDWSQPGASLTNLLSLQLTPVELEEDIYRFMLRYIFIQVPDAPCLMPHFTGTKCVCPSFIQGLRRLPH